MNQVINGSLPITARLLADDLGIKCHFGASGFSCSVDANGVKHLNIPNLPLENDLAEALALGGIVHEDGHYGETDLLFMQSISNKVLHSLVNVLEDIRIEACQIRKYAGARKILSRMINAMVAQGKYFPLSAEDKPVDVLIFYILYRLRVEVLKQESLKPAAVATTQAMESILPLDVVGKLSDLMFQVTDTKNTREVYDLSVEILTMLKDEHEKAQQQEPSPEEDGQGESDENQSQDSQSSEQDGNPSESDQQNDKGNDDSSEAQPEGEQQGDQSGGDQNSEASEGGSQQQEGDESPSQGNTSNSDQENEGGESDAADQNDAGSQQGDQDADASPSQGGDQGNSSEANGESSSDADSGQEVEGGKAGGSTGGGTEPSSGKSTGQTGDSDQNKADALAGILSEDQSPDGNWDVAKVLAETLGELTEDEAALIRLPDAIPMSRSAGDGHDVLTRIRQETNAVRRKTLGLLEAQARTKIMNGRSGSRLDVKRLWRTQTGNCRVFEKRVEGMKQNTAIQLLVDRSISMQKRIPLAMDAALSVALAMEGAQGISTSVAAFPYCREGNDDDVLLISDFGESFRKTATRFPAVGVDGCTPMAQAMLWSGYHLHAERKDRKILCVVTDGQPDDLASARNIIASLEQSGVEVIGIGINLDVSGLFRTSGTINELKDLPSVMFSMLQEKLAKAA